VGGVRHWATACFTSQRGHSRGGSEGWERDGREAERPVSAGWDVVLCAMGSKGACDAKAGRLFLHLFMSTSSGCCGDIDLAPCLTIVL
jgi:hypothetical protein